MASSSEAPWRDAEWLESNLLRHGGLIKNDKSGAQARLASELGVNASTISTWVNRHIRSGNLVMRERTPLPQLVPVDNSVITISGDAAPSSDWHLPLTNYNIFHEWLDACYKKNIRTGICAGDMVNLDHWSQHYPKQQNAGIEVEAEHAAYAVSEALDVFDELIICLGNHDERVHKQLGYSTSFDHAMRMLLQGVPDEKHKRIRITSKDYVLVETEMGVWRICHTRSYSLQPLAYPIKLAMRHNQHIAAGHRHHLAQGYAPNGKMVVELGGFYDADRTEYLDRYTNHYPKWQPGWWLLENGMMNCPMLYTRRNK